MYESDPGSWAPKDPAPEPDGCTARPDAAEQGGPEILRPAWHRRRRALGLPGPPGVSEATLPAGPRASSDCASELPNGRAGGPASEGSVGLCPSSGAWPGRRRGDRASRALHRGAPSRSDPQRRRCRRSPEAAGGALAPARTGRCGARRPRGCREQRLRSAGGRGTAARRGGPQRRPHSPRPATAPAEGSLQGRVSGLPRETGKGPAVSGCGKRA